MPPKPTPHASGPNNPLKRAPSKAFPDNGALKTKGTNAQTNPPNPLPTTNPKTTSLLPSMAPVAQNLQPVISRPVANDPGSNAVDGTASGVNRKKQKRREKQAARLAAEQAQTPGSKSAQAFAGNGGSTHPEPPHGISAAQAQVKANGYNYGASGYDDPDQYEPGEGEDLYYTDDEGRLYHNRYTSQPPANGPIANGHPPETDRKSKKKKNSRSNSSVQHEYQSNYPLNPSLPPAKLQPPPPPPPPLSTAALRSAHHISKDRIWNTSTAEERERIKEFWLSLGEEDRRSLVKVEKEAVLKKMKEQQKHSCSCTVCGRKRTAIEEELEVLYDAYYEELEQYANHQQISLEDGTPIIPPPRMYTHPMARLPPKRNPPLLHRPSRGRVQEVAEDDEEEGDEEDYSDEDDDDLSEEEPEEPMGPAADFFNFGNSLTVQGGILTVADDLLKNDGKKFIEMMEQLAERRMQREEEAQYAAAGLGHASMQPHNHGPSMDDDGYDDEDDDEYDSQDEEEDYEEDEMETMTEEQRMEEGRRMFQIFAARMFEQRVLTAYREKVAAERQQKLIEELEEEDLRDTQREAKKAKEAQKKKDKKRQQKQLKDEEKAKREAEKAAEEAAARAAEENKLEEQRLKKEEQRRKREAEKKAQEDEKQRKEAEKLKRLQEAREQQAELERKQREAKEREKKKREEQKKMEREEREAKEKESKEKKEREAADKKEQETKAKAEKEMKDRSKKDEHPLKLSAQAVPKPSSPKPPIPLSALPTTSNLHPQTSSSHASPHLSIATPAIPKAPTPVRPRQPSVQGSIPGSIHGSHSSSPKASQPPSGSSTTSPSRSSQPQNGTTSAPGKAASQPSMQHPPPNPTLTPIGAPPGIFSQPPGFQGMPAMTGNGYSGNFGPMMPPMTPRASIHEATMFAHQPHHGGAPFRNFMPQNGMPFPPGVSGGRPMPPGPGINLPATQAPGGPVPLGSAPNVGHGLPRDTMPSHSHSRQSSASFDRSVFENTTMPPPTQPIARPTPIQRPSSVAPHQQGGTHHSTDADVEDLSNHLGSSALLDDTDVPLSSNVADSRRGSMAPGGPRHGFGTSPMFPDPIGTTKMENFPRGSQGGNGNTWGMPPMPFGAPPMSGPPSWSNNSGPQWPNGAFGNVAINRQNASRAVTIRHLICQACNKISANPPASSKNGFHSAEVILRHIELMKPANEGLISLREMMDICDTEGNSQNGGGSFTVTREQTGDFIRFEAGRNTSVSMRGGVPGDIGSPIPGGAMPVFGGGRQPFQHPGGIMSPSNF